MKTKRLTKEEWRLFNKKRKEYFEKSIKLERDMISSFGDVFKGHPVKGGAYSMEF